MRFELRGVNLTEARRAAWTFLLEGERPKGQSPLAAYRAATGDHDVKHGWHERSNARSG